MNKKIPVLFVVLFLGSLGVGGISISALAMGESDPMKSFLKSRNSLELVESCLILQETGPVRAYGDYLREKGKDELLNRVRFLEELYAGNNAGALQALDLMKKKDAWSKSRATYLSGLMEIQRSFAETKSDHFVVRVASEDAFLSAYALPSLETAYSRVGEFFGSSPTVPSVIEIYPTVDAFSAASTRPKAAVEKTGEVTAFMFGRIMVLSPGATAFGYRWLDGMVHAYVHQNVNRLSGGRCPAWLQEGGARYLEVAWRRPDGFAHTPSALTLLTRAVLADTGTPVGLLSFDSLESAFANFASNEQRTLALAEATDAVDYIVQEFGVEKVRILLQSFREKSRADAFQDVLGMSESDFEKSWRSSLADLTEVPVDLARGALGETVSFGEKDDLRLVDEEVRSKIALGDQLLQKNQMEGAVVEYKKAIEQEPDNGVALTRLARAYVTGHKIQSADELLKRSMEKNPDYAPPYIVMGGIYFDDGRYEEAQQVLQQALEINPFQSKIHEILGMIAVDVGNFVLAKQSLELALRFDPANDAVRQSIEHMPKPR